MSTLDFQRYTLPGSILLLALTQIPGACQNMAALNCQKRFAETTQSKEPIVEGLAYRWCMTPEAQRPRFEP